MTDYTKLADACVRVGVGSHNDQATEVAIEDRYNPGAQTAEAFIKDGRTVLALQYKSFLKCSRTRGLSIHDVMSDALDRWDEPTESGFAVAIAEACLRALGEVE